MAHPTLAEFKRRDAEFKKASLLPVRCDKCGEQLTDTHPRVSLSAGFAGSQIDVHCTDWRGMAPVSMRRGSLSDPPPPPAPRVRHGG